MRSSKGSEKSEFPDTDSVQCSSQFSYLTRNDFIVFSVHRSNNREKGKRVTVVVVRSHPILNSLMYTQNCK